MLKNEIIRYFGLEQDKKGAVEQRTNIWKPISDQFVIEYLTRADLAKKNKLMIIGWFGLYCLADCPCYSYQNTKP